MTRRFFLTACCAALALWLLPARAARAQQTYRILDMGLMSGTNTNEPRVINGPSQVAGNTTRIVSRTSRASHGYLWENGAFYALPPVGTRDTCHVESISDTGLVVGTSSTSSTSTSDGVMVLWRKVGSAYVAVDMNTLLPPNSGWTLTLPPGISPNGRYLAGSGRYGPDGGAQHGFVAELSPDGDAIVRIAVLGNLGGRNGDSYSTNSRARGVNDAGQVTGYAFTGEMSGTSSVSRAFRITPLDVDGDGISDTWFAPKAGAADPMHNALMEDLGTLGGSGSNGARINAAGKVAGFSYYSGSSSQAFLWSPEGMVGLGFLWSGTSATAGSPISQAWGLNDSDTVVGWANLSQGGAHAFVSTSAAGLRDLNGLKAPGDAAYLELTHAYGINNGGRIVGRAIQVVKKTTYAYSFLAIPVP